MVNAKDISDAAQKLADTLRSREEYRNDPAMFSHFIAAYLSGMIGSIAAENPNSMERILSMIESRIELQNT